MEDNLERQMRKEKEISIGLCSCRDCSGVERGRGQLKKVLSSWLWSPDRLENLDGKDGLPSCNLQG